MPTYQINAQSPLFLGSKKVSKRKKKKAEPMPVNHIVVIDCSGSMYSDLPKIRQQLKQKLPSLLKQDDTLSIVWFSGRGQFGVLVEGVFVATLLELSSLHQAIDRWLKTVGLTGFKEPLHEVVELSKRLQKINKNAVNNLFFMSDGYDNQWSESEILQAMEEVSGVVASTTIVEYGYYCNRPLMAKLAEVSGGACVFNEDFQAYAPTFEAAMERRLLGGKRIAVDVGETVQDFAFAMFDGQLLTFAVDEEGMASVPEYVDQVFFLSTQKPSGKVVVLEGEGETPAEMYAALALYAQRMKPDVVFPLLRALGDVALIRQFASCFGKQQYSAFVDMATLAVFDPDMQLVEGQDPSEVPDDDAFTLLELLNMLQQDDNKLLLEHPELVYKRTGRARVASPNLSDEDKQTLAALKSGIAQTEDVFELKELQQQMATLLASVQPPLRLKMDEAPDGVPISKLVFNEKRPNVSIQTRRTGVVDLSSCSDKPEGIPDLFPSFVWRNYTIIKDGIVNVEKLPLHVTRATWKQLKELGLVEGNKFSAEVVLDLSTLPTINRRMVQEVSAEEFIQHQYELTQIRAEQKVYQSLKKEHGLVRESMSFQEDYGKDATAWLKQQGITDYSGFQPAGTLAEAQDFYLGKELRVKLKGFASLPKVSDVQARIADGKKRTPVQEMMVDALEFYEDFLQSEAYTQAKDQEKALGDWLDALLAECKEAIRERLYLMSQLRFSIIVGQTWFSEFSSLDEDTLEVTHDEDGEAYAKPIKGTFELKEVEVKISL
ncbi:MAG: hypothetical protein AAGJ35_00085 [Myxococcota bacterium]